MKDLTGLKNFLGQIKEINKETCKVRCQESFFFPLLGESDLSAFALVLDSVFWAVSFLSLLSVFGLASFWPCL